MEVEATDTWQLLERDVGCCYDGEPLTNAASKGALAGTVDDRRRGSPDGGDDGGARIDSQGPRVWEKGSEGERDRGMREREGFEGDRDQRVRVEGEGSMRALQREEG
ncbi:hypothetical protein Scep_026535 [Stephania cephalantha]|uniref:Uncharacterized protein n=1 Tax=Stephania cephalantha TaxID=152367 RepID=A0AAP0EKD0_9MAGN